MKRDLEKYLKTIKIDPKAKYLLIFSKDCGITAEDLMRLRLDDNFLDELILVEGDVNKAVNAVRITRKLSKMKNQGVNPTKQHSMKCPKLYGKKCNCL